MTVITQYENCEVANGRRAWTLTAGAGTTATFGIAPPAALTGGGAGALRVVCPTGGAAEFYSNSAFGPYAKFYNRFRLVVTQDGLTTASNLVYVAALNTAAFANVAALWVLFNNAGTHQLLVGADEDGNGASSLSIGATLAINTLYDCELLWDSVADVVQAWVNGTLVMNRVLSGAAAGWTIAHDIYGSFIAQVTASQTTYYVDRIVNGTEKRLTKAPFMLSGVGRRRGRSRIAG